MSSNNWKGKSILVVEDDEISLEFLKELFEPYGIKILSTIDGKTAIDICRDNTNVDLVLMDVQLPIMSGIESMKEIKKLNANLPIIAQTAFAMSGDKEKYLKEGFNDYISKPINLHELLALVTKYFG